MEPELGCSTVVPPPTQMYRFRHALGTEARALDPASNDQASRSRATWTDGTVIRIHDEVLPPSENDEVSATILIVAREPSVRSVTRRILERSRFHTLEACDDEEAIAVFHAHGADIHGVVLDLGMRDTAAETLAGELRRDQPTLPILFTGGYGERASSIRVNPDRTTGFLAKPFGMNALAAKAADLFGGPPSAGVLADSLG